MTSFSVALAGLTALFVELTLIRFVPSEIRVLGYFTNFVLFAAFLGFGLGILVARRWPQARFIERAAPLAFLVVVVLAGAGRALRVVPSSEEFLFLEYQTPGSDVALYVFLAVAYALIAASCVPIGFNVGRTLDGERPLRRYALNVAGSLAGILLYAALSAVGAPPWVNVGVAAVLCCSTLVGARVWQWALGALVSVAAVLWVWHGQQGAVWSPYQKISRAPLRTHPALGVVQEWRLPLLPSHERARVRDLPASVGFTVRVNDDSYQTPVDLSDRSVREHPELRNMRAQYDAAFHLRKPPGRVLIIGAGTGNDVAAALRAGAERVDAVEIDPAILSAAKAHPERPYDDPRVHVHLDDARAYLTNTARTFDQIVYGLLDSHVLTSHGTNVRLDSYVFTVESFKLARKRLAADGILIVSHAVGTPWFVERMQSTLAAAFGRSPLLLSRVVHHPLGFIYAQGANVPAGEPVRPGADVLEDDWPFVYASERIIPGQYLLAIGLILLLSVLSVAAVSKQSVGRVDPLFFALGAGFMLLEARGLAALALVAGSTWLVTSAVFGGVLVMALLATGVASRLRGPHARAWGLAAFVLLAVLLAVNFFVPIGVLTPLPALARVTLGALLVCAPLFASGVVFGVSLERRGHADLATASNLLGALAGGLLEYVSMVSGMRYLLVVAAAFYLWAALAFIRGGPSNTAR